MSLLAQYVLLEPIPGGSLMAFKARERSWWREVRIHKVTGNGVVQRKLLTLGPEKRALIIESGDDAGESYVVTVVLPGGATLEDWLGGTTTSGRGQWEVSGISQMVGA